MDRSSRAPPPPYVDAPPPEAKRTPSGLRYLVLAEGAGTEHPGPLEVVEVSYTAWTTDGAMLARSGESGAPTHLPINGVIPGLAEGLRMMTAGARLRLWIPQDLAYKGAPGHPAGMLVYDVEMKGEVKPLKDLPIPPDLSEPPPDAHRTPSGLAILTLEASRSGERPRAEDTVELHYSGWTADGRLFDSSLRRRSPVTVPLSRTIPGWTEGLQLMGVGEKARLWVPEALAYRGMSGAPKGMVVFEIELLGIR